MKKGDLTKLVDYSRVKFKVKKQMRYDDVGDYFDHTIVAYDMKNPIINNAILLHEFIEYTLIRSAGIPTTLIDAFDTSDTMSYKYKKKYLLYTKYHRIANNVERHFIENMGLSWKTYQKAINSEKVATIAKKDSKTAKKTKSVKIR